MEITIMAEVIEDQIEEITIYELENILQAELEQAWRIFMTTEIFRKYTKLASILGDWYESGLRESVPHPAYQLAAQHIGRGFVETAAKVGISFDQIFPGNIENSRESEEGNFDVRRFSMNTYRNGEIIATVYISFPHVHGAFNFPEAPIVEIVEV